MKWFLDTHCQDMAESMRGLIVDLTGIVIRDNYLEHPDVGILRQREGTAMGTGLSVVYANTFMLWFEEPIVNEYDTDITLYTRYIDDGQLLFTGSPARRTAFLNAFNARLPDNIKIDGIKIGKTTDFLDCTTTMHIVRSTEEHNDWDFTFSVYRKPMHAFMYLPFTSAHRPPVFRAWIKAELTRYILLSSTREGFEEQVRFLASVLQRRGYPAALIAACVEERGWAHAPQIRASHAEATARAQQPPRPAEEQHVPPELPAQGCVITTPYVPLAEEWITDPEMQLAMRVDPFVLPDAPAPVYAAVAWSNSMSLGGIIPRQRPGRSAPGEG
jgi:hypothetical protein